MVKSNWPTRKLGEVAEIHYGKGLAKSERLENGKYFAYGSNGPVYKTNKILVNHPTIIIGRKGAVGALYITQEPSWPIDTTFYIKIKEDKIVSLEFMYFLLLTKNLTGLAIVTAVPGINRNDLYNLKTPLPAIEIQQEITERLDAIRKARQLNDKQIALADELFQSLSHEELDQRKKEWEVRRLEEVTVFKRGPFGGSLKKEIFVERGYKVYEQKNAIYNDFTLGNYFIDEDKYREMIDFAIHRGALIVSCSGTIGKVAKVPADAQPGIINQALLKITPLEKIIIGDYLKLVLETPSIQQQLTVNTRGSAIRNVASVREIKRIKLFLPPLETQRQIVEKLQAVQDYKKKLLEQKQKLQELFESCLDKAMKGELV